MAKDIKKKEEKQEILEPANAGKARLIAAVMVVIAIFFGTRSSLMSMRNEALDYFNNGDTSKNYPTSIVYALGERVSFARHIVVVAKRYVSNSDYVFIENVETDCDKIEKGTEPNKLYKYNEELGDDIEALLNYLDMNIKAGKITLSEKDEELIVSDYISFDTANQPMGHSEYNEKAKEFNEVLSAFPTNITSKLAFVKPLSLFAY